MRAAIIVCVAACWLAGAARADGIPGVGNTIPFPKAMQSGAPAAFELWQWGKEPADRKRVMALANGMQIPWRSLPAGGLHVKWRFGAAHDAVQCEMRTSDSFDRIAWGPEKVAVEGSSARLYRAYPEELFFPPQVGRYCISVDATKAGKSVSKSVLLFDIVEGRPAPRNTEYLRGKRDSKGNEITWSQPVELAKLNETPVLKDNDYAFEPQHAYNVVNWERFPPFSLPKRFIAIWNSRRFSDEERFGGPLNRGFTSLGVIKCEQDNLPISQRAWFHTPDLQVMLINKWYTEDPAKYADLKAYADYRSAFVSAENAHKLGAACYEAWGAGGYGPYDPGIYGWDEEQMWPTIGTDLLKKDPALVPESVRHWRDRADDPDAKYAVQAEYSRAWGEFVANGYRGARDAAAKRGRTFRIWHYGSKAPGEVLFYGREDGRISPETGKPWAEEMSTLWSWFQKDGKVDYNATEYARQIDYYHKDFYYHVLFPEQSSMYEKDGNGQYVLDERGRRKVRRDVVEESVYVTPTKVGYEDFECGPVFLKSFLAKGENALYWLNGAKTYKHHGTLMAGKQLIPALRPGNQETWGECAKLGSRPVNPYLAEASTIYTYMMGLEGLYLWDARLFTGPAGFGPKDRPDPADTLGDLEFMVKGMHRVSHFSALFEGDYDFVRPIRTYETYNRDHPVIRGILNGRYLVLAMTNPYLDPGEKQSVEVWYDAPYQGARRPVWSGKVELLARRNHLFQCKLPALPAGRRYDPDRLFFRYTCADGTYRKTYTLTGNYDVAYPY